MSGGQVAVAAMQLVIVVGGAPLLVGVVRKVRSRLEGRSGAPILQPWREIAKQLRKEAIRPEHTSWVFWVAPLVLVATSALVAMVIPFLSTKSPFASVSDLFGVVALLLLGSVFLALAGLDPGTAFGGMGASREMTIAALAEPALLVATFALAVPANSTSLAVIVAGSLDAPERIFSVPSLLALGALAIAALAETARLPVDNPSTHLELTMVHEAMVLEYAGPDLALVELATAMRLTLFVGLLVTLFVPWGVATSTGAGALAVATVAFVAKVGALGVLLACFEVQTAKLRLFRVPELLAGSFVLGTLAVIGAFFLR
jgi:formate hydrogenlyase subunit 4